MNLMSWDTLEPWRGWISDHIATSLGTYTLCAFAPLNHSTTQCLLLGKMDLTSQQRPET